VSMQNYYNLLYREEEREMLRLCSTEGIGVTPWSPLARGRLARPWSEEPLTDRAKTDNFARTLYTKTAAMDKPVVDRVNEVAAQRGVPPSHIALGRVNTKPQRFENECKDNESREQHIQLVEAAKDPPEAFEPAKEPLDFVAPPVNDPVIFPQHQAIGIGGNHGNIAQLTG